MASLSPAMDSTLRATSAVSVVNAISASFMAKRFEVR